MITEKHIEQIFKKLRLIYGGAWANPDRIADAPELVRLWLRVLADLDESALLWGMIKLERSNREFPPTPGQFRAMCATTADDLGLPDVHEAYRLAASGPAHPGMHPIAWLSAQQVGVHEIRTLPTAIMLPKFRAAYEALMARALAGEVFIYPDYMIRRYPALKSAGASRHLEQQMKLKAPEDPDVC